MQKQEQVLHAKDVIFIVLEGVDYMADYRPDLKQNLVKDGVLKTDSDLSGSEPHVTLVKPKVD